VPVALVLSVDLLREGHALPGGLLFDRLGSTRILSSCWYVSRPEGKLQGLQLECEAEVDMPVRLGFPRHLWFPQLRWDHGDAHVFALLVLHGDLHCPPVHPLDIVDDLALDAPQLQGAVLAAQEVPLLSHADVVGVVASLANVPQQVPLGPGGAAGFLHKLQVAYSLQRHNSERAL